MGAGFIYLIIVGLWVAYFLPRWIHAHEEHAGRSVDRYQALLDVVGRTATGEERHRFTPEKREQLLHTRRVTFLALSSLFLVTVFLAAIGMLSAILVTVPMIGIASYVFVVRRQISAEEIARRINRATHEHDHVAPGNIYRNKYAELITKVTLEERSEEWIPLAERDSYQSKGITLLPKGSAASRETWEPTQVPSPSYLSAPRVVQTRRVIDLTTPGAWSAANAEKMEEASRAVLAPNPDQIFDQEVAEEVAERIERLRRAN
jgi:hypothetical protein